MRSLASTCLIMILVVLTACTDRELVYSDSRAAPRVAFAPGGTLLDLTYLTCRNEDLPEVRVLQTDGQQDLEWVVEHRTAFGSPFTNGSAYYSIRRGLSNEQGRELGYADQRDAPLTITVEPEHDEPVVVRGLRIADLAEGANTLATGDIVDDLEIQEWEARHSEREVERGCGIDPRARLHISNLLPARGRPINIEMELKECGGNASTPMHLRRITAQGRFQTVATRRLNQRCRTDVNLVANFKRRSFFAEWRPQDERYGLGMSGLKVVRTVMP